jgi:hypothetical protein
MDWVDWHKRYEWSPALVARLRIVEKHIAQCLDACQPGSIKMLSLCAGDGRDLIGVLTSHARARDVKGWLVELDSHLVQCGRAAMEHAGLTGRLEFIHADATMSSTYIGIVPVDVVLACGVFGNLAKTEIARLIRSFCFLCNHHGRVVWTRHLRFRDGVRETARIRRLFCELSFEDVCFEASPDGRFGIGTCRYVGSPTELSRDRELFRFPKETPWGGCWRKV